jgi:hypothetical protein
MGILIRRIERLRQELESGQIILPADDSGALAQFKEDLLKIQVLPNGEIDLTTCTALVRQLSKTILSAKRAMQDDDTPSAGPLQHDFTATQVEETQREYFQLIEAFFENTTGRPSELFAKYQSFTDEVRADARNIGNRLQKSLADFAAKLQEFYGRHSSMLMRAATLYSGLNAVIGGTSGFPQSAFDGYRKMALYADTVFIPDPVLPWIESARENEAFRAPRLLQACHDILRLRPLANARLPYPAVLVFPSWEKSLEAGDEQTIDGIEELTLSFFSHYLGTHFDDQSEVLKFIQGSGRDQFRLAVNSYGLLIPPQCDRPVSVDEGIEQYRSYIRIWRPKAFRETTERLSPEAMALMLISERLAPQFHLRDNARMLKAHPLFWHPTHYHYFHLCANATSSQLEYEKVIDRQTVTLLAALNTPPLAWLGNVSLTDLVRLRESNANEKLRNDLAVHIRALTETALDEVNRVGADIARGIASLLSQHSAEVEKLWHEYKKKLVLDSIGVVVTAGAALSPLLSGLVAALGTSAAVGNFVRNLIQYGIDSRALSRSLMGILSSAKQREQAGGEKGSGGSG